MEIFKKVSEGAKTITESAKTIGKKSTDLVETARLKLEISRLEKEVENNLAALGKCVYLKHKGEGGMEGEIERLLKSTGDLEAEIKNLEEQVARLNPKPPVCPACRTELPFGARFCFNCGEKIAREEEQPPPQQ